MIEPTNTERSPPVIFTPKKDGSIRFCIYYRRLNSITVRDSYLIPRMDYFIDSLGHANIFITLDSNSGYWEIPVAETDRDKTAFIIHQGLSFFKLIPLGLKNAPDTFHLVIYIVL